MAKKRQRKHQRGRRAARQPSNRRWQWLLGLAVVLIGVGAVLWATWRQSGSLPPGALIAAEQSAPAAPFALLSDAGEQVDLATYLGKQPVVLVFYMGDF